MSSQNILSAKHFIINPPHEESLPTSNNFQTIQFLDWLQYLKQFFINVSYHILVASLTLMALFKTEPSEINWPKYMIWHIDEILF